MFDCKEKHPIGKYLNLLCMVLYLHTWTAKSHRCIWGLKADVSGPIQ